MVGFGERIRNSREELRLTQEQLAKRVGVSKGTISNYEKDNRFPTSAVLIKLSNELHVSIDYLLNRSETESVLLDGLSPHEKAIVRTMVDMMYTANKK